MQKRLFLLCMLCMQVVAVFSQNTTAAECDTIHAKTEQVKKSGAIISRLSGDTPLKQPLGISSPNSPYSIVIDKIEITSQGGFLDASVEIPIPGSSKSLFFKGKRIAFSATGGFTGVGRLELISEVKTSIIGGMDLAVSKDGKTFVEFDCNGFKQMGLSADLLLNSNLIAPADSSNGKVVKAHIETVVKDANDMLASVSISPFKIRGLDGFVFDVKEASWDQSDFVNPSDFRFPSTYSDPVYSSNPTLWRGIHIKKVEVALPSYLKGSSKEPLKIKADNLLYDDSGISGVFSATNVLSLDKGEIAGGFALSINNAKFEIRQNELENGTLEGSIRLPVSSRDTLRYSATADVSGRFVFTAKPQDSLKVDIWKAKARIAPSSLISIENDKEGIVVKTLLSGDLSISAPIVEGSKKTLNMTVPFEEMFLSNRAPYFAVKAFGVDKLGVKQTFAGFSYSINSIGFSCKESRASLSVDLSLAIGGSDSNSFSAGGKVELVAVRESSSWKYKELNISSFKLSTEFSGFKLSGSLALFNDSKQYGDGIAGNVKMELKPLKFELSASAIFGSVDGYSYWYADAFSTTKIQIGTGLTLTSFGGGAFTKMRQGAPANDAEKFGVGSSGICYIPSSKIGLGFMAKVGLASSDGKLVNGDAALEMAFNQHGGISYISFLGYAEIMAGGKMAQMAGAIKEQAGVLAEKVNKINTAVGKINTAVGKEVVEKSDNAVDLKQKAEQIAADLQKDRKEAPITATLYSIFDFENSSFFAKLEAKVNLAGVLKGIGPDGKAGEMVMYFGRDKWYVHCGNPTSPIGLELLGMARAKSYFMMGHDLPAFPEPPKRVTDIIGLKSVDRSRDISSLAGGTGVAFGASLEMDTGNIQFLMFYARFAAGLGFDVMLKNYGNSSCAGEDGRLGINGWYAMGQAWAYVEGEIGIRVRMMFIRGRFPILKIGMGTLLEAQLPNPCWFHGAVGGYYNILGGAVKGKCKFEFELGKKCKIKSNAKDLLANMNVISDLRPSDGASDASVFSKPQAVLNMPVEKSFEIDAPDGERYKFRAKLDRLVALHNGSPIIGETMFNEDSTVVTVMPHCTLPPKQNITVSCELSFEEYKHGRWVKVTDEGRPVTETKAVTFATGEAPSCIPEENVAVEYPVHGQQAFYKDEYGKGFVVLNAWQDYLFTDKKYKTFAAFNVGDKQVAKVEVATNYNKKQIDFDIPQSLLSTATDYKLRIINEPIDKNSSIDKNVVKKEVAVNEAEGDAGELSLTTKEATADLVIADDKVLYEVPFKTSMYNRLKDKINSMSVDVYFSEAYDGYELPKLMIVNKELFDEVEKGSSRFTRNNPLVQLSTDLSNESWYKNEVKPLIYDGYPFLGIGVFKRDLSLGIPPRSPIYFDTNSKAYKNQMSDYIFFHAPITILKDYYQISDNIASVYAKRSSYSITDRLRIEQLINTSLKTFYTKKGEKVTIQVYYVIPNGDRIHSCDLNFEYFINK